VFGLQHDISIVPGMATVGATVRSRSKRLEAHSQKFAYQIACEILEIGRQK